MLSSTYRYIKKQIHRLLPNKTTKGFTLLETLIAVFLLTLALTGPIYIATLAIRSSVESRDSISAYFLAEEVIEVIRNNRDTRSLSDDPDTKESGWLRDSDDSVTGNVDCFNPAQEKQDICVMNRDGNTGQYIFTQCVLGECPPLNFNPNTTSGIIYGNADGAGANSKFTRSFYIESAPQDPQSSTDNPLREARITVEISWQDRGRVKSFVLVEYIHNLEYYKYGN